MHLRLSAHSNTFVRTCVQVKPAFGTEEEDLRRLYDLGIIPFSDDFTDARSRLLTFARQVRALRFVAGTMHVGVRALWREAGRGARWVCAYVHAGLSIGCRRRVGERARRGPRGQRQDGADGQPGPGGGLPLREACHRRPAHSAARGRQGGLPPRRAFAP